MRVSVIIPTYNRAGTIERAVNSVLGQTWKLQEVIVVDDGSTDRTMEVLARYGDAVKVIRQPNQGPSAARNTGIKAATGEIISFLDSDDEWLPEKTERQVKLLEATKPQGVTCCVCNARMEFPDRTVISFDNAGLRPRRREAIWLNPTQMLLHHFLLFNQVAMIKREALDQTGCFRQDLHFLEDYDLALRLSLLGPWAFSAEPLVLWHGYEENSLSRTISGLQACRQAYEILKDLGVSAQFGPRLPGRLLRRRVRHLRWLIRALQLSGDTKNGQGFSSKVLLKILNGFEAIPRRLGLDPRMKIRDIDL